MVHRLVWHSLNPVEGEDLITQLLPRCLSKWLNMGKIKKCMAGMAWKPLLPCIFDLLAVLANFTFGGAEGM